MNNRAILAHITCFFALTAGARATQVVDQQFLGEGDASFILAEGDAYVGQVVTAEITGSLVRVELNAERPEPDSSTLAAIAAVALVGLLTYRGAWKRV